MAVRNQTGAETLSASACCEIRQLIAGKLTRKALLAWTSNLAEVRRFAPALLRHVATATDKGKVRVSGQLGVFLPVLVNQLEDLFRQVNALSEAGLAGRRDVALLGDGPDLGRLGEELSIWGRRTKKGETVYDRNIGALGLGLYSTVSMTCRGADVVCLFRETHQRVFSSRSSSKPAPARFEGGGGLVGFGHERWEAEVDFEVANMGDYWTYSPRNHCLVAY